MNTLAIFILGLLIGWLIEWIIDWFYWRKKYNRIEQENQSLKQELSSVQTQLETEKANRSKVPEKKTVRKQRKDNLARIHGIGPVIAKKLNAAGIVTFEQLAALKPKQLETILGELVKRLADEDDLIAQAGQFARKKKSKAQRK